MGRGVGLLFGAANGLAYGTVVALAARVAEDRRGLASGLVVGAYAAGPAVLCLVAPRVLPEVGWRTGLAVLAVLVTGLVGIAAALAPVEQAAGRGSEPEGGQLPVPGRTMVALPGLVVFATAAPLASAAGLAPERPAPPFPCWPPATWQGESEPAGGPTVGRVAAVATRLAGSALVLAVLAVTAAPAVVLAGFAGIGLVHGGVSALIPAATADRVGPRAFPTVYGRVFTAWGAQASRRRCSSARVRPPRVPGRKCSSSWRSPLSWPLPR